MYTIRRSFGVAVTLCTLSTLLVGGCPTGTGTPQGLPDAIKAVIDGRDAVQIAEDDPALSASPGRVVDSLSGLDGCWARYTSYAPPEGLPASTRNDVYTYYRFDTATGQMTNLIYGELTDFQYANLATYKGTFTIDSDNHLTFHVSEFNIYDPYSGQTLVYPEGFAEQLRQAAANGDMTQEQLDESLAELEKPLVFEYEVTLEGNRVTIVEMWDNDGTTEYDDPEVCFRITCPD